MIFIQIVVTIALIFLIDSPLWAKTYIDLSTDPTATPSAVQVDDDSEDSGTDQHSSNFSSKRKATGNKVFIFNPRIGEWAAYSESGNLVKTGRASGGKGYCPDIHRRCRTPVGTFRILSKGTASCRSTRYPVGKGGAPMPYCMFFSKYYAVHGSNDVPDYNASHGCIRVTPAMAKWLSKNFIDVGTTVIVKPY